MALETWSPSGGGGFGPNIFQKPPGEGWSITGYNARRVQTNNPKMGSGYRTVNIPIYSRMAAPPAAPPPPPPPPAAPAPSAGPRNPERYPEIDYTPISPQGVPDVYVNVPAPPPPPPPMMTIGGASSSVDSGATGFRRKRSSARLAGLTSKGTSQLKITGQSARSSGLNIG